MALLDREPLDRWNRGNATLLGDAAHPMFPFFAQGAAQAIEDGAVLALCLAADPDDPIAALGRYEELRRRRTARIQEVSHSRSHINHLPDGPEQQARDLQYSQADPLRENTSVPEYNPRQPSHEDHRGGVTPRAGPPPNLSRSTLANRGRTRSWCASWRPASATPTSMRTTAVGFPVPAPDRAGARGRGRRGGGRGRGDPPRAR
ncbi:Kynurenine 3-monooxygenase [Streptomyces alboniger]